MRPSRRRSVLTRVAGALFAGVCAFLSLAAHAAPDAQFRATPVQGDPCVAPCAVHFDAIGDGASATTDPVFSREFHTLLFEWDFGDPDAGTWSLTGADKDRALGAIAGHLYTAPGTYSVTLTVTNPVGETSVAEAEVEVADPDVVFGGSGTWCFANSGVPGGAGSEACPSSRRPTNPGLRPRCFGSSCAIPGGRTRAASSLEQGRETEAGSGCARTRSAIALPDARDTSEDR
jgi:hypothetical protein